MMQKNPRNLSVAENNERKNCPQDFYVTDICIIYIILFFIQ